LFAGLINNAKSAVGQVILKYVARASVATPFVIAVGFALAAITVMLVQRFGHVIGFWLMAVGLAAIGVIAAIAVSIKEHEEKNAGQKAGEAYIKTVMSDTTAQAVMQAPVALLGAGLPAPGGATTALKVARILGRNFPLVLLLVMISALFWPTANEAEPPDVDEKVRPNGFQPAATYH
jgi:hypothetical protein